MDIRKVNELNFLNEEVEEFHICIMYMYSYMYHVFDG